MKIFVVNTGSSSIKCSLYLFGNQLPVESVPPIWESHLEWKEDSKKALLKVKNDTGITYSEEIGLVSTKENLTHIIQTLCNGKTAVLNNLNEIDAVGHRIVHGGSEFTKSVLITSKIKEKIRTLADIATIHNLANLDGIEAAESLFKDKPQFAVFDTGFHQTLPLAHALYPGPYAWREEGIRRYGFHGISHQYCSHRAAEFLQCNLQMQRIVVCHLGSGSSLCAIKNGKSIDTTMGFTPLEGLMMDTRSGTIDPGIILYLLRKEGITIDGLNKVLNHQSGLLGISGISSDMRDIITAASKGVERAQLAIDMYVHRLNSFIGSMIASLGGIDILVFTGGIGENTPLIRKKVSEAFSFLPLKLDLQKNAYSHEEDAVIS
ncbi:MAG: acetate kinase, partial [Chlamydiae bacterium]|nr:acetate kinase [Chlamydiota bacterium]